MYFFYLMKNKNNYTFINIVKHIYIKLKNFDSVVCFLYLCKIKSYINLYLKFILFFIVLLTNSNTDFTSIWDLGDLVIKIVEDSSSSAKESINNIDESTSQIAEVSKEDKDNVSKNIQEIDFDAMEFEE